MKAITFAALAAALSTQPVDAQHAHETKGVKVTMVYDHALPGMPYKSIKGVLVEYEPGGVNAAHTHAKSAIIYATVLEGAVLNQLNGGPVRTFAAGQNFTELPGDKHEVSANASKTEPPSCSPSSLSIPTIRC
jgi:quercetin dioxygenase-like cupin family protein